jgi:CPA1 family monovalent cation:H+ antiporter
MFDRSDLYQLSFDITNTHHRRGMTKNLMGRELFGKGVTFSRIRELHHLGATFKATLLSDTFTFASFEKRYGHGPLLLCAVDSSGKLLVNTVDAPLQPEPGQTIITLVTSTTVPDDHAAITSELDS